MMLNRKDTLTDLFVKILMILMLILLVLQTKAQQIPIITEDSQVIFSLFTQPDRLIYELNFNKDGKLNQLEPLKVKQDDKKNITSAIRCEYIGNDGFEIRLIAYQKMPFYLLKIKQDQVYKLYVKNGSDNLPLRRLIIKINKGSFQFPNYQYIDLITLNNND